MRGNAGRGLKGEEGIRDAEIDRERFCREEGIGGGKRRGFGGMEVNRKNLQLESFCCDFGKVQVCCRMYCECIVHGNCRSCKGRISARNHLPNYAHLPT